MIAEDLFRTQSGYSCITPHFLKWESRLFCERLYRPVLLQQYSQRRRQVFTFVSRGFPSARWHSLFPCYSLVHDRRPDVRCSHLNIGDHSPPSCKHFILAGAGFAHHDGLQQSKFLQAVHQILMVCFKRQRVGNSWHCSDVYLADGYLDDLLYSRHKDRPTFIIFPNSDVLDFSPQANLNSSFREKRTVG